MSKQIHRQAQTKSQQQSYKVGNPSISRLNDKYASKISSGEIQVTASRTKSRLSPNEAYDHRVKQKKLAQAQKEKEDLQKKLAYLDHSIKSIQHYDYSSAKVSPELSPSPKNSVTDVKQILKKNQEFHKRIREERQKLTEKKQMERKKQEQKIKLQQQKLAKQTEEQKSKRKQQIYQNMQKIKARMENRQSQIKKQEEQYHKVIGGTTLFKKLEKEYAQHQQSMLEQRKKKLANIRNLHKPINMSEIEEHQRKFFEALQEKKSLRDRQRRLSNAVEEYRVSYKSSHHKQYSQQHSRLDQENQSRIKADKMKQFSEHVREHFAPQIDERKREDREKILQCQIQKKRKQQMKQDQDKQRVEQIRNKGLRYLQEIRDLPKKREESSKTGPVTERPRYTNYLSHSQHNGKTKWGSILESKVSKKDKAIRLQFEAEKMETNLKLKEQKARLLKNDPDEVDEEYYEMIKAKLQLLQI